MVLFARSARPAVRAPDTWCLHSAVLTPPCSGTVSKVLAIKRVRPLLLAAGNLPCTVARWLLAMRLAARCLLVLAAGNLSACRLQPARHPLICQTLCRCDLQSARHVWRAAAFRAVPCTASFVPTSAGWSLRYGGAAQAHVLSQFIAFWLYLQYRVHWWSCHVLLHAVPHSPVVVYPDSWQVTQPAQK